MTTTTYLAGAIGAALVCRLLGYLPDGIVGTFGRLPPRRGRGPETTGTAAAGTWLG